VRKSWVDKGIEVMLLRDTPVPVERTVICKRTSFAARNTAWGRVKPSLHACVSIRQHTSAYVRELPRPLGQSQAKHTFGVDVGV
jgi:hypothetical protein